MKNDHSNWMYKSFGDACLIRRSRSRELAESLNTVGKLLIVTTSSRSFFIFIFINRSELQANVELGSGLLF